MANGNVWEPRSKCLGHQQITGKLSQPLRITFHLSIYLCINGVLTSTIMFSLYKGRFKRHGVNLTFLILFLGLYSVRFCESKRSKFRYSHYKSRLANVFENFTRFLSRGSEKDGYYTNTWAVVLHEPAEEKDLVRIASKHGFRVLDKVRILMCVRVTGVCSACFAFYASWSPHVHFL